MTRVPRQYRSNYRGNGRKPRQFRGSGTFACGNVAGIGTGVTVIPRCSGSCCTVNELLTVIWTEDNVRQFISGTDNVRAEIQKFEKEGTLIFSFLPIFLIHAFSPFPYLPFPSLSYTSSYAIISIFPFHFQSSLLCREVVSLNLVSGI